METVFESQKQELEMTEAEREELDVRKRRAEGTPCTREHFDAWQAKFLAEMAERKVKEEEEAALAQKKKDNKKDTAVDKSGRLTGFEQFSGKMSNLEALEAAAEEAERTNDFDEELFDDDVDLDDLDFDDDEEEAEE